MTNSSHILPLFASTLYPLPVGDLFCYVECTQWKQNGFLPTSFGGIEDRLWVKKFNMWAASLIGVGSGEKESGSLRK